MPNLNKYVILAWLSISACGGGGSDGSPADAQHHDKPGTHKCNAECF
jgi:hypothetical protein